MDNIWIIYGAAWWLSPTLLTHMTSSIGMTTFPRYGGTKMFQSPPTSLDFEVKLGSFFEQRKSKLSQLVIIKAFR